MPALVPPPKPRFSGRLSRMAWGAAEATSSGVSVPVPLSTTTSGLGRSVDSPTLRRQASVLFRLPQCTTTTAARTSAAASPTAANIGVGRAMAEVLGTGFIGPQHQARRPTVLLGHAGRRRCGSTLAAARRAGRETRVPRTHDGRESGWGRPTLKLLPGRWY